MTTIVTVDGYSYSIKDGWQGHENSTMFDYGFAPEIPGAGLYRFVKTGDRRPMVGSAFKTALFAGSIHAMVYALDKQMYRSMTSIAFEALAGAAPGQVLAASAPVVAAAAVSVAGASAYIAAMEQFEPDGNVHDKSSFWSSIGAALAGTFGGMPDVGNY